MDKLTEQHLRTTMKFCDMFFNALNKAKKKDVLQAETSQIICNGIVAKNSKLSQEKIKEKKDGTRSNEHT